MRQYPLICGNVKCKTSQTPLWRKGWTTTEGKPVMLCNACGLHYKKGHFCIYCNQIYKESDADDKEEPWIGCDSCHRWVHQHCEQLNNYTIQSNGYLCPCCRNQSSSSTNTSNTTAIGLILSTAINNKHYEPILMKPRGGGGGGAVKEKKRRRKPTLEVVKKIKREESGSTSNRLYTPNSSNSNNSINQISINSSVGGGSGNSSVLSTSCGVGGGGSGGVGGGNSIYFEKDDCCSYYKENENVSVNSKLSLSSDDEYSYDSNTEEEEEEEETIDIENNSNSNSTGNISVVSSDKKRELVVERNNEFICGEDYNDDSYHQFIIWDPLHDKRSSVEVSFEQVESLLNKNFGYSTELTRKIQSLSAICEYELSNLDY